MAIAHIVTYVSLLIGDENNEDITAVQVEEAINLRRTEMRFEKCTPLATYASGGALTYVTFTAPNGWGWWDDAVSFTDSNYDALSPATSDLNNGRWTFAAEPTQPVRITGFTYDVYAAAADLLETRAAEVAEDITSFAVAHGSFSYANRRAGPMQMAKRYRMKQRPSVATVFRTDVHIP